MGLLFSDIANSQVRQTQLKIIMTLRRFCIIAATFVYTMAVSADSIKNITVNNITYSSAEINWDAASSETKWNVRYKPVSVGEYVEVTLTVGDVWGDGSGYQMLLDADATAYGDIIPTSGSFTSGGDAEESVYAQFEYKIPEAADGTLTTSNIVENSSVTIMIPAGRYDWVIVNPNPGKRIWIASANGNLSGRQDDYFFEPGKKYEFVVSKALIGDQVNVTITDTTTEESAENGWIYVNGVVETMVGISGLDSETIYMVQVQADGTDGDAGEWSAYTYFTTLDKRATPANVTINDITESSAAVDWLARGAETKWNLRYRKVVDTETYYFEDGWPEGWTTIDADGDGRAWKCWTTEGVKDHLWHSGKYCMMSESYTPDVEEGALDPDNWLVTPEIELGGSVSFWMRSAVKDYPDNFSVRLSTKGCAVEDFSTELLPQTTAEGEYTECRIDLSEYSGKGYVAFRHHDSADMYYLLLDDVTIAGPNAVLFRWSIAPDVMEKPYVIKGLNPDSKYEVQVQAVYDDGATGEWSPVVTFTTLDGLQVGDVNKDGTITIADVTALVNIILGKDSDVPYQYNHEAADCNQDGTITIADVTALVNIILGKR